MKATELRIGNWVKLDLVGTQNQVTQILQKGVNCGSIGVLYEMIKPIPLTEEWLERFGWVKSKDRSYFWHDSNLSLWFNDNGLFIESVGGKLYIKHLHQLQNLYHALTGEELQTDETKQKVNQ